MKLLVAALLVTSLACSKKEGDSSSKDKPETPSTDNAGGPEIEPFAGKLTADVLRKANRAIVLFDASGAPGEFAPALAMAKKALGPETHVANNVHAWGYVEGDKCIYYAIENKGGKAHSNGMMEVDKLAGGMYETCMTSIGKAAPADGDEAAKDGDEAAADGDEAAKDGDEAAKDGDDAKGW